MQLGKKKKQQWANLVDKKLIETMKKIKTYVNLNMSLLDIPPNVRNWWDLIPYILLQAWIDQVGPQVDPPQDVSQALC